MSENNVQKAWETYGVCRELICSKNFQRISTLSAC